MAQPDIQALRATIADLKSRLDALPPLEIIYSPGWEANRAEHKRAMSEIADYLTATHGARIKDHAWNHTIRMHGISSSCTSGLSSLLQNWLRAAERKVTSQ